MMMQKNERHSGRTKQARRSWAAVLLLVVATSCTTVPGWSQSGSANVPSADNSIFAASVLSIKARLDSLSSARRVLWVNPRPLSPDSALIWIHDDDFPADQELTTAARLEVLKRLGIRAFRTFPEATCFRGGGGLPPRNAPPAPADPPPYPLCAFVSLPRPGGLQPPAEKGEQEPKGARNRQQIVRVFLFFGSTTGVYDLVVRPDASGPGWSVRKWREVFVAMS